MGREIRKVPANWEHPKYQSDDAPFRDRIGSYKPLFNQTFDAASKEWKEGFIAWERGERPDYCSDDGRLMEYWEWHGAPPDRDYYRSYSDDDAVWFQVYETVSEGSPVTPPFATRDELVDYLATHGDFWDQNRGDRPWNREVAAKFVGAGFAPSFMMVSSSDGNAIYAPRDGFPA